MSASELLKITNKKHNEWSEPRKRLSEKGIIDTKTRGQILVRLPRLKEFLENEMNQQFWASYKGAFIVYIFFRKELALTSLQC